MCRTIKYNLLSVFWSLKHTEHLEHAGCLVSMFRSSGSIPLCALVEDYQHRHQMG